MTGHTTHFEDRAAAVRAWAQGWLPTEAAAELLIGHRAWLLREDFWRVAVEVRWEVFRGQEVAAVDFAAAASALEAGTCRARRVSARSCGSPPASRRGSRWICGKPRSGWMRWGLAWLPARSFTRPATARAWQRGRRPVTARELVTVRRHRDPLDGQTLPVLGRYRRGTQLLVVLPGGSKRVIPAAWTDERAGDGAAALASPGDLLELCALVSALFSPGWRWTGTGCTAVTVQGGQPCSLHSSVCCRTRFRRHRRP